MPDWPHSPLHRLGEAGAYMVTAGTYRKLPLFRTPERLTYLCGSLLELSEKYGWQLQAWAVLANHYHFVAVSPPKAEILRDFIRHPHTEGGSKLPHSKRSGDAESLRDFIRHLHSVTARQINLLDETPGRQVWFEYWETHLTFQKSYFARLNYVHRNAVRHGLAPNPSRYPWCSASWFERRADPAFYRMIMDFPSDKIKVPDDYKLDPLAESG